MNAITFGEVFPLLKENKVWLGNGFGGVMLSLLHQMRKSMGMEFCNKMDWLSSVIVVGSQILSTGNDTSRFPS